MIDYLSRYKVIVFDLGGTLMEYSGMPDELFKRSIPELLSRIDLYVSSQSCGYRKPNARGISYITDYFGVENSNLLLVGDEEKDHRTAINAGCDYMFIEDYLKTTFRKT